MDPQIVKIIECSYINHDVKRFVLEKPVNFNFIPGQSAEISINLPEWKNRTCFFTFTSLNEWPYLELIIKIYNDHNGVTHQLGKTNAGAELIIHDVFGVLTYSGPGVFIAGGAGITPFIAILRDLYKKSLTGGNKLILSNKTSDDIILASELKQMLGDNFINILTREGVIGFMERRIDRRFLVETIRDFSSYFYVCGPQRFVEEIAGHLISLGALAETVIFER